MEKYKCKLCSKFFNNGRALGGHMRSHLVNLPIYPQQEEEEYSSSSSLSITNPKKRRSNRVIKRPAQPESFEPVSSVSDTSPEEDVALSLMMLSRDTWHKMVLPKHRCGVCGKVFKSTQALGGHRTSHKKAKRNDDVAESLTRAEGKKKVIKKKTHECPICCKVFGSGQALGGHKRSHFLISPVNNNAASSANNINDDSYNWIDLNMPAPMEDDDEISAVSVAEFNNYC